MSISISLLQAKTVFPTDTLKLRWFRACALRVGSAINEIMQSLLIPHFKEMDDVKGLQLSIYIPLLSKGAHRPYSEHHATGRFVVLDLDNWLYRAAAMKMH